MAAATLQLGSIFGAVAILNYDDVTLLSSGITFNTTNLIGNLQVSLDVVVAGQHQSVTAGRGLNATLVFSPSITLTQIQFKGKTVVVITNAVITMQGVPP